MKRACVLAAAGMAIAAWALRNRAGLGEWLRRLTDGPTNLILIGTSGFEREGRDPTKTP
jgi:hypothetical protein